MPSPIPKPANLRQRRNKSATNALLQSEAESAGNDVPELPAKETGWHPMVVAWWGDVWRSPMASEYLAADKRGLFRLAMLEHDFWSASSAPQRLTISAEIRHAGLPYGLSPIDRRRLQWQVEQGETAAERTAQRRAPKDKPGKDVRASLSVA